MTIVLVATFISLIVSIGLAIALFKGIQLEIKDPDCQEDINNVNTNVLALKVGVSIIVICEFLSILLL